MPVTIVVGGQFGSEGKGKVAHYLAREEGCAAAVRVGGPNSGHTVIDEAGNRRVFQQLPTAAILDDVTCVLPTGSYIRPEILMREVQAVGLALDRLVIDPKAMVILAEDVRLEQSGGLGQAIGSTMSGTGAAVARRVSRRSDILFASEHAELKPYVRQTVPLLRNLLASRHRVLIEGTQGFGLSLLHTDHYPHATSRDTTAAACLSESGLSPLDVDRVVLVIRAFPIRVGGNSGPLPSEIDWERVTIASGSAETILEYTTVSQKLRRVARFDPDVVREAIAVNRPTDVVLNHLDYVDALGPSEKTARFAKCVSTMIGTHIDYLGFGPASLRHVSSSAVVVCEKEEGYGLDAIREKR